jgi:hypothetical protein
MNLHCEVGPTFKDPKLSWWHFAILVPKLLWYDNTFDPLTLWYDHKFIKVRVQNKWGRILE